MIVTRGGVVESVHSAHVVVAPADGPPVEVLGDGGSVVYPRSALKPLQALAVRAQLGEHGATPDVRQLAIACASHRGADDHQVEAAGLLAEAGLDESALRCPAAWPEDAAVRSDLDAPTTLSHNCSGKHAAFLWAHTAAGEPAGSYLDPDSDLQQRIAARVGQVIGEALVGPGVDGCGAPAWRCSLSGLARGFARLEEGRDDDLRAVRAAMTAHPHLIGGEGTADTAMMLSDTRVVAKRGAEGIMACGFTHPAHGPLGIAVKVLDGAERAAGPLAAAVCHALGAVVPTEVLRTPVLGGGRPQGEVVATPDVAAVTTEAFGLA